MLPRIECSNSCLPYFVEKHVGNEEDNVPPVRLPWSESPQPDQSKGSLIQSFQEVREFFPWVPKAQYLLLSSPEELEREAVEALKAELSIPVYSVGPVIPYLQLQAVNSKSPPSVGADEFDYLNWLDRQPEESVL